MTKTLRLPIKLSILLLSCMFTLSSLQADGSIIIGFNVGGFVNTKQYANNPSGSNLKEDMNKANVSFGGKLGYEYAPWSWLAIRAYGDVTSIAKDSKLVDQTTKVESKITYKGAEGGLNLDLGLNIGPDALKFGVFAGGGLQFVGLNTSGNAKVKNDVEVKNIGGYGWVVNAGANVTLFTNHQIEIGAQIPFYEVKSKTKKGAGETESSTNADTRVYAGYVYSFNIH